MMCSTGNYTKIWPFPTQGFFFWWAFEKFMLSSCQLFVHCVTAYIIVWIAQFLLWPCWRSGLEIMELFYDLLWWSWLHEPRVIYLTLFYLLSRGFGKQLRPHIMHRGITGALVIWKRFQAGVTMAVWSWCSQSAQCISPSFINAAIIYTWFQDLICSKWNLFVFHCTQLSALQINLCTLLLL